MKEKIKGFLEEIKPNQDLMNCQDYIEEGILDSFDVIELINMIEDEFDIIIDGLDIVPDNFSNLDKIEELINKSGSKG